MDRNIERPIDRPIERLIDFRSADIIASGPIASASVASEALLGSYFMQTDDPAWPSGRLWLYRRGLRNVGTDFVDLGRPSQLTDLFIPENDYTVEVIFNPNQITARYIFANTDAGLATSSIAIFQQIGGVVHVSVNGVAFDVGPFNLNGYNLVKVVKMGASWKASINGVFSQDNPFGSYIASTPFFIGGRTDGTGLNFDGDTCCFRAWAGANVDGSTDNLIPVVNWKLDEPAGSTQVIDSVNGLIGTVSDGAPAGYVGVPMLVPTQW